LAKRSTQKRDRVEGRGNFYAKREEGGQFREKDEVGRATAADRRQAAKRKTRSGFGDQGDRSRRSR
jgi:hypothetical protein